MWTNKIDRSKQLKKELQEELNLFFTSQPYRINTKTAPISKRLIYFVTKADKVPEEISLITGDIIQNLRSALDQFAYQLYIKSLWSGKNEHNVYFPIADSFEQYTIKTEGLAHKAKKIIDTIKPYKEGNNTLWQIHKLNNIDKHRLLVTVGSSFRSLDIGTHMITGMREAFPNLNIPSLSAFIRPADNLFPLKIGDELFVDSPNAKVNPELKFQFDVVLNEPDIIKGAPLIETIQTMIDTVDQLVPIFKKLSK